MQHNIPGLVGEDPGVCSDGDKLREERFPHEPPVRFTGVTAPGGLIGVGVRRVAPNNDDKDMDLSTTGVELAFLGVAGLNPRSEKEVCDVIFLYYLYNL